MSAIKKTKDLKRLDAPIHQLVKNDKNPNRMGTREFDLLVDNIQLTGMTDPILVRPLPTENGQPRYRIVGGHHRFDAAQFIGMETVPVTVLPDDFDEDQEKFQLVRMNMIHGKMDPMAFYDLYSTLQEHYSDVILQDAFGFAEEAEFKRLIAQTAKSIPDKGLQQKFKEAAKEIKTIDGLSKLLNSLFTKYGDTLPYGFMVFDYGGQRSVWLQVSMPTIKSFDVIGDLCIENSVTVDDFIGGIVQLIAKGELKDVVKGVVDKAPKVKMPSGLQNIPTKEALKALNEVE